MIVEVRVDPLCHTRIPTRVVITARHLTLDGLWTRVRRALRGSKSGRDTQIVTKGVHRLPGSTIGTSCTAAEGEDRLAERGSERRPAAAGSCDRAELSGAGDVGVRGAGHRTRPVGALTSAARQPRRASIGPGRHRIRPTAEAIGCSLGSKSGSNSGSWVLYERRRDGRPVASGPRRWRDGTEPVVGQPGCGVGATYRGVMGRDPGPWAYDE